MHKIPEQIVQFIEKTMQTGRVEVTAGEQSLAEVKIQRGIFQGDALSLLLFVIISPETILTTRDQRNNYNQKTKVGKKQLYGRFKRLTSDISHKKKVDPSKKRNRKRETELFLIVPTKQRHKD